jgi:mitogen-activated protein kinase kinase kinase 7
MHHARPEPGQARPELLGKGSFGKVYKQEVGGVTCVVKKIPNLTENVTKEVVAMKFNHQHIIKLRGFWIEEATSHGATLCLIMEFADRGTFAAYIAKKSKNPNSVWFKEYTIWRTLSQLASALEYLHGLQPQPVLHRDLKPDNILGVTGSGGGLVWKLADFGLAKVMSADKQGEFYTSTLCGTPIYMAPEVSLRICYEKQ